MKWLMYYLIVVNLLTWIIYGIDKWKAKRRAWRIPERTLLLLAAAIIFHCIHGNILQIHNLSVFLLVFCIKSTIFL